jgi:hypothetical protein
VVALSILSVHMTEGHWLWCPHNVEEPFYGKVTAQSGAQSLVAWEKVCWTKENGGLGIKDLSLMNICLLLKLLHRLHTAVDSAWASWARMHTSCQP